MIKPNSGLPEGASTMIFAFTEDGAVYDILAKRVKRAHNQPCLLVNAGRGFLNDQQKQAISTFVLDKQPTTPNTLA
ncbi:TrbG/VirB9 family P-type conjugative transfer protein, partial [Vibrio alfacsensis]